MSVQRIHTHKQVHEGWIFLCILLNVSKKDTNWCANQIEKLPLFNSLDSSKLTWTDVAKHNLSNSHFFKSYCQQHLYCMWLHLVRVVWGNYFFTCSTLDSYFCLTKIQKQNKSVNGTFFIALYKEQLQGLPQIPTDAPIYSSLWNLEVNKTS